MHLPILIFDIKTRTDTAAYQRIYDDTSHDFSGDVTEEDTQKKEHDSLLGFSQLPLHEVVCLSGLWVTENSMTLFSFSQEDHTEKNILQKFIKSIEKYAPVLVSWNGKSFDLPVITYRSMLYELMAPVLFDQGWHDNGQKYNNYQNRYHHQHTDLMDVFARFNPKNFQKLEHIAKFFNLPSTNTKIEQSEEQTATDCVQEQPWNNIIESCESDVLKTWFVYLRWLLLIGKLDHEQYTYWQNTTQSYIATIEHHN